MEGAVAQDHVHMMIEIPPKYSVSEVIGYLKGKSAIAVARQFGGKKRSFRGEKLWSRGYAVSTVGVTSAKVREYIALQEKKEKEAINVFTDNLHKLLLAAPAANKVIMGIDPGFRTGCKVVVIDAKGDF